MLVTSQILHFKRLTTGETQRKITNSMYIASFGKYNLFFSVCPELIHLQIR